MRAAPQIGVERRALAGCFCRALLGLRAVLGFGLQGPFGRDAGLQLRRCRRFRRGQLFGGGAAPLFGRDAPP